MAEDQYGIRMTVESWAALYGGPDLVGTREEMLEVQRRWETEARPIDHTYTYEVVKYTGRDPADRDDVVDFLGGAERVVVSKNATSEDGAFEKKPGEGGQGFKSELLVELSQVLNRHCAENASNTPDFILARFLMMTLEAHAWATMRRDLWYGVTLSPGHVSPRRPLEELTERCYNCGGPTASDDIPCIDCYETACDNGAEEELLARRPSLRKARERRET